MSLSDKEILHVARLGAIALGPEEVEKSRREINDILNYIDHLQSVPTRGVLPTSHVHGVNNVFREDVVQDSLALEELKENAPDFTPAGFRVPKIL